jgi:hypothetical protein
MAGPKLVKGLAKTSAMIKDIANRLIGLAGYELFERGKGVALERRIDTIAELEILFRRFVFPDLPECEGRSALMAKLLGTNTSEAMYVVEYLRRSLQVDGDLCEFGVAQGATSALMANEIRSTTKSLWLFDSFEGLPRPTAEDVLIHDIFNLGAMDKYQGTMAFGQDHVIARLGEIAFPGSRVNIVPGFIDKTLRQPNLPGTVCFAYVDLDFYEPIVQALEFLHRALGVGGHVVVDDYGWFSAGAQTAVDGFVKSHADSYELVLPLPGLGHFAVLARRA